MAIPTRSISAIERLKRYPLSVYFDPADSDGVVNLVGPNGESLGYALNLSSLVDDIGKIEMAMVQEQVLIRNLGAPDLADVNLLINAVDIEATGNGSYTALLEATNLDMPRNVVVTITDTTPVPADFAGSTVTVSGIDVLGRYLEEVFDTNDGAGTYVGTKIFAAVTGVVVAGMDIANMDGTGDELLDIGSGDLIGLGVPIVYGKPAASDVDRFIDGAVAVDGSIGDATYTLLNDGDNLVPRTVIVTVTENVGTLTAGLVSIYGLDRRGQEISEVIDLSAGLVQETVQNFLTVTEVVVSGLAGLDGETDLIDVGSGTRFETDVKYILFNGTSVLLTDIDAIQVGDVTEAGVDASGGTYDGSKALVVWVAPQR